MIDGCWGLGEMVERGAHGGFCYIDWDYGNVLVGVRVLIYNATGIPIVASHGSSDGMIPPAYDFRIPSGFCSSQKVGILLQLELTVGWCEQEIKEAFVLGYPMP
jgi:hypothetical protein